MLQLNEKLHTVLLQTFVDQYNALVNIVRNLPVEDGMKAIILKHCGDAYVWTKEAFVMMHNPLPSEVQEAIKAGDVEDLNAA